MNVLIVAGGDLTPAFLIEFVNTYPQDFVIAADRGLDRILAAGMTPDLLLGDYDSTKRREMVGELGKEGIPVEVYPCEKDFSDLESAVRIAARKVREAANRAAEKDRQNMKEAADSAPERRIFEEFCGTSMISILGATGGRLDHFFAAVCNLTIPLSAGIPARIVDPQNVMELKNHSFDVRKKDLAGKYISLIPFGGDVPGVTLKGFRYPLEDGTLSAKNASLGISNELAGERGTVSFSKGILIFVNSADRLS